MGLTRWSLTAEERDRTDVVQTCPTATAGHKILRWMEDRTGAKNIADSALILYQAAVCKNAKGY